VARGKLGGPWAGNPLASLQQSPATKWFPGKSLPRAVAEQVDAMDQSLEAVQLELALHSQNLISLGFEESIQAALKDIGGGDLLFQMRLDREDCQRVAAVRIGSGEEQQFALVIMPPGGGLMRVEPDTFHAVR
jgi:hypothetical protein